MKQLLLIAAIGLFFINACTPKQNDTEATASSTQQKNIEAFNTITKAFETGDANSIDSVIAEDYIDHTERGDIKGIDSLKNMIVMMHTMVKDSKTELKQIAANNDFVFGWMRYTGTSDGQMGMPTGPYDMQSIELVKFNNGKAVEHWAFMEMQDVMKMMAPQANK